MDIMNNNNNNKNNKKFIYQFPFSYIIFLSSFMLLLNIMILFDSINSSYAQNLSSSISLKVNAGEDQYVEEGKPVILNAEDSVSSDPPIDSYRWFQVEPKDPKVDLENSNTSRASFTSPNLPTDGNIVFQLIVKDGNVTDTDTVNVYVLEDLSSIKNLEDGIPTYQPEICFDGVDNDLDGKIDLQDEECGMTFMPQQQFPNQRSSPQSGGIPLNPNIERLFPPSQLRPNVQPEHEHAQPGQIQPGQGKIIP